LASKLGLDQPAGEDSRPFDIREYRDTLSEASKTAGELARLVDAADRLVASGGLEQLLPQVAETLDRAKKESEELVNHTFRQAILLILIWMVGYVAARLMVRYLSRKLGRVEG
jgi:hypothetical protein